jgi:hypothetical protein
VSELRHLTDVEPTRWIGPLLAPFGSGVASIVPRGYEAYARIPHLPDEEAWLELELPERQLRILCEILAGEDGTGRCCFCLWEGYGWVQGGSVAITVAHRIGEEPPDPGWIAALREAHEAPAFPSEVTRGPKLHLPGRAFLVFAGPLESILEFGRHEKHPYGHRFQRHTPDLFWPADRGWFVGSDVDLDFTLVGGPVKIVDAILADPRLEAFAVREDDGW